MRYLTEAAEIERKTHEVYLSGSGVRSDAKKGIEKLGEATHIIDKVSASNHPGIGEYLETRDQIRGRLEATIRWYE